MKKKELKTDIIYNEDCIEGLKRIPDKSIDLVITDPPFAINFKARKMNYNRLYKNVLEGYSEIKAEDYLSFTKSWMNEIYRILKETGSAFIFSGWNNLKDILITIDELGFTTVNHIIWKYQFGVVTRRKFVTSHYHCLFICKDDRKRKFFPESRFSKKDRNENGRSMNYEDREDVWFIRREYWTNKEKTPTKLPSEIIEKILLYSSEKNDIVLDPFLGSGQVAYVSKKLSRRYIGFELVKTYFEFAQKRLKEESFNNE
ncbi:MAG: site-specific DNA-methyltransferase [Candidatus Coatesbacteria bacterium]|nr:site-specific DNA-methyltransferase [Candidatus Coatesbacteria bacterium]